MTSLTSAEIKIVYFALFFIAIMGAIVAIYNTSSPEMQQYTGVESTHNQTSSTQDTWISNLIPTPPTPFNDPFVLIVFAIFVTPVIIMLGYVSIRAIKDLVSQWI